MRIMNWNIEHMNSWWEGGSADPPVMRQTFAGNSFSPAITDVPALASRVGNVISAVDPDIVTIQEGAGMPELKHFFADFVNGDDWHILRGSGGAQALAVAARLDRDVKTIQPGTEIAGKINLDEKFPADIDANLEIDEVDFARKPQVINFEALDQKFLLLNNHLKSKFVSDGEAMFNAGGEQQKEFFSQALKARRRISGEAFRIREYLNEVFETNANANIIITGDLNDGAGTDFFEKNFLTHSVVDRIFGSIFKPDFQLTHVLFHGGSSDFTAQFFDFIEQKTKDLVLDHIGFSPAVNKNWNWQGRVAVAEYEAQIVDDPGLRERDRKPSDHRPVVVEMTPK